MSLEFASAVELAKKIRDKEVSSRELTDHYIDRIERGVVTFNYSGSHIVRSSFHRLD